MEHRGFDIKGVQTINGGKAKPAPAISQSSPPRKRSTVALAPQPPKKVRLPIQRLPFDNGPNQRIDIGFPDGG
jgi:hypothetical protein